MTPRRYIEYACGHYKHTTEFGKTQGSVSLVVKQLQKRGSNVNSESDPLCKAEAPLK